MTIETQTALLFVYGTLMQGEPNHHHMRGYESDFIGPGTARPLARERDLALFDLGPFPALVEVERTEPVRLGVRGELYRVTLDTLARLDSFEGVPHLYQRERVLVMPYERVLWTHVDAFAYVMRTKKPRGRLIPSGSWRDR